MRCRRDRLVARAGERLAIENLLDNSKIMVLLSPVGWQLTSNFKGDLCRRIQPIILVLYAFPGHLWPPSNSGSRRLPTAIDSTLSPGRYIRL